MIFLRLLRYVIDLCAGSLVESDAQKRRPGTLEVPRRPLGWFADRGHEFVHPARTQDVFATNPDTYAIAKGIWAVFGDSKNCGKGWILRIGQDFDEKAA